MTKEAMETVVPSATEVADERVGTEAAATRPGKLSGLVNSDDNLPANSWYVLPAVSAAKARSEQGRGSRRLTEEVLSISGLEREGEHGASCSNAAARVGDIWSLIFAL